MTSPRPGPGNPGRLVGRVGECARVDGVLAAVRAGTSSVLAVIGDPGVGKTALLEYAVRAADGFQVVRAAGTEWEMDLAYAALQQLCAPLLGGLDELPAPQRAALETAFGLRAGDGVPPEPHLVGLGALNLLSEAAAERPLLCVVDDVQWLDQASARALGFVARRLDADAVALLLAGRELGEVAPSSVREELRLTGLAAPDARALLATVLPIWTDPKLVDRIVAETQGNPLALLELPRGRSPAELASEFGLLDVAKLPERIEQSFQRRLAKLPADARHLLLLAAAEPTGNAALLSRACAATGLPAAATFAAAAAAAEAGLVSAGTQVRFYHPLVCIFHPLVRSAVYRGATGAERRDAHRVLAEATDAAADGDRRAWHRGRSVTGPDDEVATELADSAERASKRGGVAAAAAFLQRAFELTSDQERRTARGLAAARTWHEAGAHDHAMELLDALLDGPLEELERARAEWLRARVIWTRTGRREGTEQLFHAARVLQPLNRELARSAYLDVLDACRSRMSTVDLKEIGRALTALPLPERPDGIDLLLRGSGVLFTEWFPHGFDILGQAVEAFISAPPDSADNYLALQALTTAARSLWDDAGYDAITARNVALVRESRAVGLLPAVLEERATFCIDAGDLSGAAAALDEATAIREATGMEHHLWSIFFLGMLTALRGTESAAVSVVERARRDNEQLAGDQSIASLLEHSLALLYNGLGKHPEALAAARRSCELHVNGGIAATHAELIEAAVRCQHVAEARTALAAFHARMVIGGDRDYARGVTACTEALLEDGSAADALYREAVDRLGRTRMRLPLARARLLYGEWLRRERRRGDAREQLQTAHEMFEAMGTRSFAERARRELAATGVTAHSRQRATLDELTPQEARVASLAADGLSNPEIAAQMYISKGTVDYHLNKVFRKLDIRSRAQLAYSLTAGG